MSEVTDAPPTNGTKGPKLNADQVLLNRNVGPLMTQVFGAKAEGMSLARAVGDSRFRNLLILDLYVRTSRMEVAMRQLYELLMSASQEAPPDKPRIVRPV